MGFVGVIDRKAAPSTKQFINSVSKAVTKPGPATYTSMVRNFRKSLCSGFSTSTTPQGYRRPLIFFPFTSISWLEPMTANGMLAWVSQRKKKFHFMGSLVKNAKKVEAAERWKQRTGSGTSRGISSFLENLR